MFKYRGGNFIFNLKLNLEIFLWATATGKLPALLHQVCLELGTEVPHPVLLLKVLQSLRGKVLQQFSQLEVKCQYLLMHGNIGIDIGHMSWLIVHGGTPAHVQHV